MTRKLLSTTKDSTAAAARPGRGGIVISVFHRLGGGGTAASTTKTINKEPILVLDDGSKHQQQQPEQQQQQQRPPRGPHRWIKSISSGSTDTATSSNSSGSNNSSTDSDSEDMKKVRRIDSMKEKTAAFFLGASPMNLLSRHSEEATDGCGSSNTNNNVSTSRWLGILPQNQRHQQRKQGLAVDELEFEEERKEELHLSILPPVSIGVLRGGDDTTAALDCDDDDTDRTVKVRFSNDVTIYAVPHRIDYTEEERNLLWVRGKEHRENTMRNKKEYEYEEFHRGGDVVEETEFVLHNGKYIHPVHLPLDLWKF